MVLVAGRFGAPLNGEQALGEWAVEVNGPWDSEFKKGFYFARKIT